MKLSRIKNKALMILLLLFTLLISGCGDAKIGYIDGDRIMKEAPKITSLINEGNQKIEEAEKAAEADLTQKQGTMSAEDFQKAQAEAQQKLMSLNQQYSMQMKQTLDTAIEEVATAQKLDAVVDNEAQQKTIYLGGVDITDAVIAKLQ